MKEKFLNLPSRFSDNGRQIKLDVPINIRELKILNLAQQNRKILKAIKPEKLIYLTEIDGKRVMIYREFYYYLKKENVTEDKNILRILERIYSSNEELPVNIRDIDTLMDYINEDKIDAVKVLNKNFKQPLRIIQYGDIKQLDPLTTARYIALEFIGKSSAMMYSENSTNVYNVNLLNADVIKYLNRILSKNSVKTIVKSIETHNTMKQNKLVARNLIPMDIIYSSLSSNKKNEDFENILNDFINHQVEIDTKMLAYIKFSLNTDCKIKVEDVNSGFYRLKVIEVNDDNSIVIAINTKMTIDSIKDVKISYKDFYYNLARYVNRYTNSSRYANKVKYNIVEIHDELVISLNQESINKKYAFELILVGFMEVLDSLAPGAYYSFSHSYR